MICKYYICKYYVGLNPHDIKDNNNDCGLDGRNCDCPTTYPCYVCYVCEDREEL